MKYSLTTSFTQMSTCRLARTQFVTLQEKQGRRRVGGRLQRTVSTKQPSDCLIRDRKRLLPCSPSAATFQEKKKKQPPSRARVGRASPRSSPRRQTKFPSVVTKQPPASLCAPDVNMAVTRCEGGRGHKQVKVLPCFLASLLIGSGLH